MIGEKKLLNHIIVYSDYNFKFEQYNIELFVKSEYFFSFLEKLENPTIVVIGGDGTMLHAVQKHYKKQLSFLGINFGNKGFLLQDKSIIQEPNIFKCKKYSLFEVYTQKQFKGIFINEINIATVKGKLLDLNLKIGDKEELNIKSDGILVSSPLGSTGYNLSLGGPLLSHQSESIIITAKAPFSPKRIPSIVTNNTETIQIQNGERKNKFEIFLDGNEILSENLDDIIQIKKSDIPLKFLISEKYETIWENKIFQL
ncbi:MAG: NAD(+)/NADH kinase [Candidatus Gracilibacteria bacterium]|nr:NAD(+)/NADH kinase [Candidatus Gracilibacteria bacterium]